ncbi:MAG: hypothetical protein Q8P41_18365 [Pseudomonadota bacterium]|nr:hypothetical protein [Pseudomonadota bacterium]
MEEEKSDADGSSAEPEAKGKGARKRKGNGARSREARARENHFGKVQVFDTDDGGFVPLPMVLRACLWLFKPTEWMVLTAVMMHAGPKFVTWVSLPEICHEMDYRNKGKLRTILNRLVSLGFLAHAESGGVEYWCVVDPVSAIKGLPSTEVVSPARRQLINDVLEMVGRPTIAFEETPE